MILRTSLALIIMLFAFSSCKKEKESEEDTVFIGDVVINTQTELDEFAAQAYQEIQGDLIIDSKELVSQNSNGTTDVINHTPPDFIEVDRVDPITDLSRLSSIQRIEGDLLIGYNSSLLSLEGFQNLQSINGDFIVSTNKILESTDFLDNLQRVGGELMFIANVKLTELGEFPNLVSVGDGIQISFIGAKSISGFNQLVSSNGGISINSNQQLEKLEGFNNITMINGGLGITSNPKLKSIVAFKELNSADGNLSISWNYKLNEVRGFDNFQSLTGKYGTLTIVDNDELQDFSFCSSVLSVYSIQLNDNEGLVAIDFLNEDLKVEDHFFITSNPNLVNYCGMRTMSKSLSISQLINRKNLYNPSLEDIQSGNCSN